jgi:hypothetical protein
MAFGAGDAHAEGPRQFAQAQPGTTPERTSDNTATSGLPRVHLMIGPGTLPSVGKDRMDLLRYRLSGNPRLTGEQMLEPLPETLTKTSDLEEIQRMFDEY